jgi:hypothetical protein
MKKITFLKIAILGTLVVGAPMANAQILASFRGGEDDTNTPPYTGNGTPTHNSVNMTQTLGWSSASPTQGPYFAGGLVSGSTESYDFDSSQNQNWNGAIQAPWVVTTNFSLQVSATIAGGNADTLTHTLVNVGNTANGFGIVINNNRVYGLLNGIALIGAGFLPSFDNATVYTFRLDNVAGVNTFYVNGVASGSSLTAAAFTPTTAFSIGSMIQPGYAGLSNVWKGGKLDEITLTAIPEPASMALVAAGFGFLAFGRRRRV